jgi:hypothetical protein
MKMPKSQASIQDLNLMATQITELDTPLIVENEK